MTSRRQTPSFSGDQNTDELATSAEDALQELYTAKSIPSTMTASQDQYTAIDKLRREIRLLKILPGDSQIQLTTQTFDLDNSPDYVALSYVWGTETSPENASLNGTAFEMRQSLHEALINLRKLQADGSEDRLFAHHAPFFWIDAVCINQADGSEKNHQVAMMGDIYRRASQTVAWVGPKVDGTAFGLGYAKRFNETVFNERLKKGLYSQDCIDPKEKRSIYEFCAREYFKRVWIIQEIILSKNLYFVCGDLFCSYDYMENIIRYWGGSSSSNSIYPMLEIIWARNKVGPDNYQNTPQESLAFLMRVALDKRCSLAHDKVYALLGILPDLPTFEIDYAIDVVELMIRVEEFVNSVPIQSSSESLPFAGRTQSVQLAFRRAIPGQLYNSIGWYWNVSEVLHSLSTNIIGEFSRINTLSSPEICRLLSDFVCWIVGAYGVDLFSIIHGRDKDSLSTELRIWGSSMLYENCAIDWACNDGQFIYQLNLEHSHKFSYERDTRYDWTVQESLQCHALLQKYNTDSQFLIRMKQGIVDLGDGPPEGLQPYSDSCLPLQVKRAVFANLLARHFIENIEEVPSLDGGCWSPDRSTSLGDFLLQGNPKGSDLEDFLLQHLFLRYRVVFEVGSWRETRTEHQDALQKTEIQMSKRLKTTKRARRSERRRAFKNPEKVWSAYLYRT